MKKLTYLMFGLILMTSCQKDPIQPNPTPGIGSIITLETSKPSWSNSTHIVYVEFQYVLTTGEQRIEIIDSATPIGIPFSIDSVDFTKVVWVRANNAYWIQGGYNGTDYVDHILRKDGEIIDQAGAGCCYEYLKN